MQFSIVVTSLCSILLLALPGFLLRKSKLLGDNLLNGLSVILLYACTPTLTFYSFQEQEYSIETVRNAGILIGLSVILLLFFSLFFSLLFGKRLEDVKYRVYNTSCIFSNCGFMGIPFVQALYPGQNIPVFYVTAFMGVFNMFVWTLGIYLLTHEKSFISLKKAFLNPATLAFLLSFALYVLRINIGEYVPWLVRSIGMIGNTTTPISMTILGIRLADVKFRQVFGDWRVYIVCFFRLVLAPLIVFLFLLLVPADTMVETILFIIMAMPSAAIVLSFSERYLGDCEDAAICFMCTTVVSVVTIPFVMLLLMLL